MNEILGIFFDKVKGRKKVKVQLPNGKFKLTSYARVVYEAAHGPIPQGMTVDHIDGDKLNDDLSNLRLLTMEDNISAHYGKPIQWGKPPKQPSQPAKQPVNWDSVIDELKDTSISHATLGVKYGVTRERIRQVRKARGIVIRKS